MSIVVRVDFVLILFDGRRDVITYYLVRTYIPCFFIIAAYSCQVFHYTTLGIMGIMGIITLPCKLRYPANLGSSTSISDSTFPSQYS